MSKLSRIWWYLTKWVGPVSPAITYIPNAVDDAGHVYHFLAIGIAIRRRPWWKR